MKLQSFSQAAHDRGQYREPLRTYAECAEALHLSPGQLTAARRTTPGFPEPVFVHKNSGASHSHYRLSEVRAWHLRRSPAQPRTPAPVFERYVRNGLLAELVGEAL